MSPAARCVAAALLLGLCAAAGGQVEERAEGAAEERAEGAAGGYSPMFTPQMIERASPEQARRMRETEARNRRAWEARQAALRAGRNAARVPVEGEQQAEGEAPRAADPVPPPAPRRASRRKIYRWVDENGNVSFGDAPAGNDAKEVKVGGVARERGTPPPAPSMGATGEER